MLLKKFKRAMDGLGDAKEAYISLGESIDPVTVARWKEDEKIAMDERGEHLRIFEVKMRKGDFSFCCCVHVRSNHPLEEPTLAQICLDLASKQNKNTTDGTLGWLSSGINLENEQCVKTGFLLRNILN